MAESPFGGNSGMIVVEQVQILNGGSSSTYYKEIIYTPDKPGYKPIAVGAGVNQANKYIYGCMVRPDGKIQVGICNRTESGTMSSLIVTATITYARNDLF